MKCDEKTRLAGQFEKTSAKFSEAYRNFIEGLESARKKNTSC